MLHQDKPDDYVLATGVTTSVRQFCHRAFAEADITLEWRGQGVDERGFEAGTGRLLVEVDPCYFRPTEVDLLLGDAAKARRTLGWAPKVSVRELAAEMVREDFKLFASDDHRRDD